jgi:predicted nucleotidyltransferase
MAARTVADLPIAIPQAELAAFCKRHHIRWLALFGSVLRDDFGPASDIDVLVDFEPGHVPGFAYFRMQDELSNLLGRRVDLLTPRAISAYFVDDVLRDAMTLYGAP